MNDKIIQAFALSVTEYRDILNQIVDITFALMGILGCNFPTSKTVYPQSWSDHRVQQTFDKCIIWLIPTFEEQFKLNVHNFCKEK